MSIPETFIPKPPGASGTAVAHNLRSYQTAIGDDYWNTSYYLVGRPPTR